MRSLPENNQTATTWRAARQTRHAGQVRLTVTSSHSRREQVKSALEGIAKFFAWLKQTAEQLTPPERWALILSYALRKFLRDRKAATEPATGLRRYRGLKLQAAPRS